MKIKNLTFALATISILSLTNCKNDNATNKDTKNVSTTETTQNNPATSGATEMTNTNTNSQIGKIVFVNIDSLNEKYLFVKDSRKKLENSYIAKQTELDGMMRKLQEEAAGYESKAQELTRNQLEEIQRTLGKKQEDLMKRKDQMESSFSKESENLDKTLKNKINDYLKKVCDENGYQLVLSYTSSGLGMLYGDKSLDITNKVITELNEAYKGNKK